MNLPAQVKICLYLGLERAIGIDVRGQRLLVVLRECLAELTQVVEVDVRLVLEDKAAEFDAECR